MINIQLPVVIWTIICFVILSIILDKFLFTPILKVIDERNEKIAAAKKNKEDAEASRVKAAEEAEKQRAIRKENEKAAAEKQADELRAELDKQIAERQLKRIDDIDGYKKTIKDEYADITSKLGVKTEEFAMTLVNTTLSGSD